MTGLFHPIEKVQFISYFIRLRLNVALGQYYTANPLDIHWRWKYWQHLRTIQKRSRAGRPVVERRSDTSIEHRRNESNV